MKHSALSPTRLLLAAAALIVAAPVAIQSASAQSTLGPPAETAPTPPEERKITESLCYAFANDAHPLIQRANFQPEITTDKQVGVTYIGHSTFLIQTAAGVTIATDFSGWAGPGVTPTVVTMNHAHSTHYTDFPDPAIRHVLRGWNPAGGEAEHDLTIDDVRIRNVPTDIRGWGGEIEVDGNSIFVFEVADLCIGHLGHLHHKPTIDDFAELGFLDIVFAPVDGGYTMRIDEMVDTLKTLKARLVIPMHAFGPSTLARFLTDMSNEFEIDVRDAHSVVLTDTTLPPRPTVMVLRPYTPPSYDE